MPGRSRAGRWAGLRYATATLLVALFGSGCATRQSVPIECVTQNVEIFVDGQLLEANPDLLELSSDEPHKVYVRAEGYEPQLYILEPEVGADGSSRLSPEKVCVELVPVGQGRQLEVEVDLP